VDKHAKGRNANNYLGRCEPVLQWQMSAKAVAVQLAPPAACHASATLEMLALLWKEDARCRPRWLL